MARSIATGRPALLFMTIAIIGCAQQAVAPPLAVRPAAGQARAVQVVDLAGGPLDVAALGDAQAFELRAEQVDPEAVQAALVALRELRPRALRLVSALRALP